MAAGENKRSRKVLTADMLGGIIILYSLQSTLFYALFPIPRTAIVEASPTNH